MSAPNFNALPPSLASKLANASNKNAPNLPPGFGLRENGQHRPILPPSSPPSASNRFPNLAARLPKPAPNRRLKPGFSLADIDPALVVGPPSAYPTAVDLIPPIAEFGLGAGRPAPAAQPSSASALATPFANFSKIVDPSGALNFNGKAILSATGVNFEGGASFAINMDQLQLDDEELGKGNYGTVKKVLHKPTNVAMAMKEIRLELDQAKLNAIIMELDVLHRAVAPEIVEFYGAFFIESCVYYCMEYMDAGSLDKLIQVPPSDALHTITPARHAAATNGSSGGGGGAGSPAEDYSFALPYEDEVIDVNNPDQFQPYNAPFNRASYSPSYPVSHYNGGPVPEAVLGRIAAAMVRGLKFLKDELNIIHRDVKPTNVLINRRGQVKLCDFGVSGQLEKSMAKTNIGCQSYMAPERIRGESRVVTTVVESNHKEGDAATAKAAAEDGVPGTAALADELYGSYTVSSDVWSLGLSIIELGLGRYPYPPETYQNVFAQLTAIVHGPPPCLPSGPPPSLTSSASVEGLRPGYSPLARDWVNKCMKKEPRERASYKELLEHPWLTKNATLDVDVEGWVKSACAAKDRLRALRGKGK